ncbi:MAG TPA: protease inhibitor I42 family protein [Verrucomicrobiae bacterium]|nr:protease inhibitor I42 family protein [Verrucomicrobiae bacterium]
MTRASRILAGLALWGLLAAPAAALQPHSPVFTNPSIPVTVAPGEDFFIALASNPTTGYGWTQSLAGGKILTYEGNVYQGPSNGLVGAGGQQLFIYHADRSGDTTIDFAYARPFEQGLPPARSVTFSVTVR